MMETRMLTVDEVARAVEWLTARRMGSVPGLAVADLARTEALFLPFGGTVGAFADDGRMVAAGAVFWPVHGRIGFIGKVVSDPAGDPIESAAALKALAAGMLYELRIHGMIFATTMYEERTLDELFREAGIPAGPSCTACRSIILLGGK